ATKRVQVGEVRGKGLMIGVELIADSKKTPAKKQAAAVKADMMKRGFLIGVGGIHKNVLRVQPPLLITANEIVSAAGALDASIAAAFL
ncbi:MAG: aminotransferase class III-fold pyridoxal phosphate-dependent enzyme, partial [Candidatus Gagatemarchaeaceae archaeon]